jgi:pimeloyl-ACP methyl ester carboxylesterase
VIGDKDDAFSLTDIDRVRRLMPTTNIWIVPDTGHGAHRGKNKELFIQISKDFLSKK